MDARQGPDQAPAREMVENYARGLTDFYAGEFTFDELMKSEMVRNYAKRYGVEL